MTVTETPSTRERAAAAMHRAREALLSLQSPEGWWAGEVETNVTMEAQDLLMREFLGIRTLRATQDTARWIRSRQREDGTWTNFHGGPPNLSTTVEAYVALRLAGYPQSDPPMERAAEYIRQSGGLEHVRVFTKVWLALFGVWDWRRIPIMPPEVVFLPSWVPLSLYRWAYWARQTIVPLSIVMTLRPVRELPFRLDELRSPQPVPKAPLRGIGRIFTCLDRVLHRYHDRPIGRLRRAALRRAEEWILARQEKDGCWGGIQPPWVYSMIALTLLGYPHEHPVLARAFAGLDRYTVTDSRGRRFQSCTSPVWDTVLAVIALADSGTQPDDAALVRAARWIIDEQIHTYGDWRVKRPALLPGGWAFEFDNDIYPDTDDTAEAVLALSRVRHPGAADAIRTGLAWMTGMASRNGAFGAFDADNTSTLCAQLPFCDFGALTDPPSADVTGHVLEALCAHGRRNTPTAQRALDWLLDEQDERGSWYGRWGVNHLYGTSSVLPALLAAGVAPRHPAVERAVAMLQTCQNSDGGWGEDCRSYTDPAWIGRGPSTPSQTAWALIALLAADPASESVERGITWLTQQQRRDGNWDEDAFTGTGFPGDMYLHYDMYRLTYPLTALARFVNRPSPAPTPQAPQPPG
ncbi:squalene--hopene cyclase [Streptomyces sp. NPDC005892]|uniref:squalene--hopene cyclase n=1 Tax=Streptomyces sp. NPDC005892 TaxID=3155593 RepID=UPI0033D2AEB1